MTMLLAMTVPIAFTVPLNREAHHIARQLSTCQFSPKRAKRVYLNVLAAYAAKFYLNCMEIEVDSFFDRPISKPELETFSSLEISGIGPLECCPILADDRTVQLPAETWGDRIGYMTIQFDESLTTANLIGFLPKTSIETVELDRLDTLDNFIVYISQLETAKENHQLAEPISLSQGWFDTLESGWKRLESLFPQPQFAWRDRSSQPSDLSPSMMCAKVLELGTDDRVTLSIELGPMEGSEIELWIRVYALPPHHYLPENLKLSILDDRGAEVIQAEARTTENIQVKFIADLGEKFGIRVELEDLSMIEYFLV
jgi:Protein of unknown function (DUF1822)